MAEFPFSAVAGQAGFKTALLLAAINPAIGGVLVSGPRGCAKSTLVRALADLLPDAPFVTLPLGASEEMLTGTLDLQQVLNDQQLAFRPGLLSKAHQGMLYVDEVNLLADPLVDLLLDVSASGVNHVERDGISQRHDARFVLIGTMNPDEGELREQLKDRFGLMVELDNRYALEDRVRIVRARDAYDRDPEAFCQQYAAEQQQLQQQILAARSRLVDVQCDEAHQLEIARRCDAAQVDGLRGDIVWYRAALSHAAWRGGLEVETLDIDAVEPLVLAHRRQAPPQSPPPESPPPFQRPPPRPQPPQSQSQQSRPPQSESQTQQGPDDATPPSSGDWGAMGQLQHQGVGTLAQQDFNVAPALSAALAGQGGKRAGAQQGEGRRQGAAGNTPDWFASLVSSLPQWPPQQLRFKQPRTGAMWLHLVLLDTSASTLSSQWLARAKAVVLDIGKRAYLAREQLAIIGFGNQQTDTVLARVRAPKELHSLLEPIQAGGGTPLRQVLGQAQTMLSQLLRQNPALNSCTYLITDGRCRDSVADLQLPGQRLLIDTEQSSVKRGRGPQLAAELGADYHLLSE